MEPWEKKFGVQPDCSEAAVGKIFTFPSAELRFVPDRDYPVSGRWQTGYQFIRCGKSRIHQVIFQASETDAPTSMYFYHGVSRASEPLLREAMPVAVLSILVQHPESSQCKDIELYWIVITQPPVPFESRTEAWKEKWTFWVCGKLHDAVMRFEPNVSEPGVQFFAEFGRPDVRR